MFTDIHSNSPIFTDIHRVLEKIILSDAGPATNLKSQKRPMKTQKLNQIKPGQTPDIYNIGFTIYERLVRAMAVEGSHVLVRAMVLRGTCVRPSDPRSGLGTGPNKTEIKRIKVNQGCFLPMKLAA